MSAHNLFDWKDGEYQYCADIVRMNGTREVPESSLTSYLNLQIACATRDRRPDVADALSVLLAKVQS